MIAASCAINGGGFGNFVSGGITTHNDPTNTYLLFSPNNFFIGYFHPANTHHFYTICITPANLSYNGARRCAITYHVLLNHIDHNAIDNIVNPGFGGGPPANLDAFIAAVEAAGVPLGLNPDLHTRIGTVTMRHFIAGRVNI